MPALQLTTHVKSSTLCGGSYGRTVINPQFCESLKKITPAYLFKIELEIVRLPIQIEPLLSEVQVLFFVFFFTKI